MERPFLPWAEAPARQFCPLGTSLPPSCADPLPSPPFWFRPRLSGCSEMSQAWTPGAPSGWPCFCAMPPSTRLATLAVMSRWPTSWPHGCWPTRAPSGASGCRPHRTCTSLRWGSEGAGVPHSEEGSLSESAPEGRVGSTPRPCLWAAPSWHETSVRSPGHGPAPG